MESFFPFHLLPPSLATSARPSVQMYILSKDSNLLRLSSYLSKSFHHRSLSYLYQQFRYHPLTPHTIINYIISHSPTKWSYINPSLCKNQEMFKLYTCLENQGNYQRRHLYTLFIDQETDYLHMNTSGFNFYDVMDSTHLRKIRDYMSETWLFDLVTLSKVLCCQRDPNYIKNYLLNYLSNLYEKAKTKIEKVMFFIYLILNLLVYDQESYLPAIYWVQEIDQLIRVKYENLVDYLQKN